MTSRYGDLSRPPLSRAELTRALVTPASRWSDVSVVDAVPSTNAELVSRSRTDRRDGLVLIAEHQTEGRGRLDRAWEAPPRAGLTMSVLVRPPAVPVSRWSWIPLLSGLAVAAALQQVAQVAAVLKWPNDVMVEGHKLGGLLVERVDGHPGEEGAAAVIGIGVNVTTTRAELPTPSATSLALEGASTTDRSTLVKAVLRRLEGLLAEWENGSGVPSAGLRTAYLSACSTVGQSVRVELPGQPDAEGVASGIDAGGRLLVETPGGARAFGAGDVVHVRAPA